MAWSQAGRGVVKGNTSLFAGSTGALHPESQTSAASMVMARKGRLPEVAEGLVTSNAPSCRPDDMSGLHDYMS
jgi:hypothetical protein